MMRQGVAGIATAVALACGTAAWADPVPRGSAAAGSVIARKTGEEVRFIDVSSWRGVDIHQDLLAGDELRTNALGSLAVLFSDNTQVRLGRNTTMLVKQISSVGDSHLSLEAGSIWARAERGGDGIVVETPAAAAAIRGTDWTMTVDGDRTSLIVLEGTVELANEFGSVSVTRGEAASARIGQAPAKTVIVDPDDREQMLFYLSLRTGFGAMPASPLSSRDMRQERARISALPESQRGSEDWLTLAEVSLSYDGRQAARQAAEQARKYMLSASQRARLDLIDGLMAASAGRYSEANALFERAEPKLTGSRRAMAAFGGYFARSLANPRHVERPPAIADGGPYGAMIEAWSTGFLKDIPAALEVLKRAEQRYPYDPTLPAARALLALLVDDREQVKEATDRALMLDPDEPMALEARANYRAGIEGDLKGAQEDLTRASEIAPGSSTVWNGLGLVLSARGASREAEVALRRAIELDPEDPVSHGNLALIYLEQDRVKEAKIEIDKALALDPGFDVGLIARGKYHLQTGEMEKGVQDLLAGTTANPAYAQGLLLLSAGYYESGLKEPAAQALDNADRLDPNDPAISAFRTALAIDEYRADDAIDNAREYLRRTRARGGDFAALSANKDAGSTLNEAYRLQGLDAWGRFYGQAVFDPFGAAGYVDQTLAGSPNPFANNVNFGTESVDSVANATAFSTFIQGLMFNPAMLSGRSRSANIIRRPFMEGSIGGGFIDTDGDGGWNAEAEFQGYQPGPFPWSYYGQFNWEETSEDRSGGLFGPDNPTTLFRQEYEDISGTGYFTASPTPNDRIVAYFDVRNDTDNRPGGALDLFPVIPGAGLVYTKEIEDNSAVAGLAWSHTIGYRNVVNAALFATKFKRESTEIGGIFAGGIQYGAFDISVEAEGSSLLGAVNHTYGVGDDLTLRYGVEGGIIDVTASQTFRVFPDDFSPGASETTDLDISVGRAYFDALYEATPNLQLEAGLFGTVLSGGLDVSRLEPRAGIAWTPAEGHWLRAGFLRETNAATGTTLAPFGVVGLQSLQAPLDTGGYSDTFAARWDAEWGERFFTSVDYQHQELTDLSVTLPADLYIVDRTAFSIDEGRLDRIAGTANVRLGGGFGAFGTVAYSNSEITRNETFVGDPLPFVPEWSARMGLTYVSAENLKITLAGTYIGERQDSGITLDDYWTADAFLTWEPFDKRFELELAGYNLLGEDFLVAYDVPGWGRTFTGSLKVRF